MNVNSNHTLLLCYAHPDDESFTSGGVTASAAAQGATVALVCATRGEVGEISAPHLATLETLPQVREQELRCACEQIGVTELIFLDYRDSGMPGTPENEDPRAFTNIPANEVVPRLVGLIRRLRPQVVVTFDPSGGYGHPDHIAIHDHTIAAFYAAGNSEDYPEFGPAWQPARLLYAVLPRSTFTRMRETMVQQGIDTQQFDRLMEMEIGWPDDEVHYRVDVSRAVEAKLAALSCHRTQFGPDHPFRQVIETTTKEILTHEYFVQAWPERDTNSVLNDIFEGL